MSAATDEFAALKIPLSRRHWETFPVIWNTTPAPRDREIMIIGKLMISGDYAGWGESVRNAIRWDGEDWTFADNGLPVRQSAADILVILYWCDMPADVRRER